MSDALLYMYYFRQNTDIEGQTRQVLKVETKYSSKFQKEIRDFL